MRLFLLTFLIPLLAGCTMATRTGSPAEWLGIADAEDFDISLKQNRATNACTENALLKLKNEMLQKQLEDCKNPPPARVSIPVDAEGVKIKLKTKVEEVTDGPSAALPQNSPPGRLVACKPSCPPS